MAVRGMTPLLLMAAVRIPSTVAQEKIPLFFGKKVPPPLRITDSGRIH